jgi:hypothetical protein
MSVDEIVVEHLIHLVAPPLDDPPNGATDFVEAIVDAARRHGRNGRGKGGVGGYIRMLAEIKCKTFDKWIIRAMLEQVKGGSPQSIEEAKARLRKQGVDVKAVYDIAHAMKYGRLPPENKPSSFATDLQECVQYIKQQNYDFNRESPETMPAGLDPSRPTA